MMAARNQTGDQALKANDGRFAEINPWEHMMAARKQRLDLQRSSLENT
jgi:hypothetical protein